LAGPAVSSDGTIYYTAGTSAEGHVQAVSSSGEGLWVTKINTPFFYETPHPSKDGEYVFLKNDIFSADNGHLIELESDFEVLRYFSGENGKNYLLSGHKIIQWEQSDNTIEMLDVSEWDSSHFSDIIAPAFVGVNEDGVSWQLYTSPGGNTQNIWVSEDDRSLGASEVRISSSTIIDMREDLSAFICGGGPFNPSSTDCASLNPSSNDPIWKFHLGNYGPVSGGVIVDQRYFVTTEDGYAFEINENFEEVLTQSTSEIQNRVPDTPIKFGVMWTYQASDTIAFDFEIGQDGLVYISTDDGKLHIIEPGGKAHNVIELPGSPYHRFSQTGRSAPMQLSPKVLSDGTIIFVSDENIIYALDPEGNQLWEHALQGEPAELPLIDNNGNYYLLDLEAGLNSFDKDGLNWRLQSEAAKIPARGFTLGPDGTIYFVVTNYSNGFIQAVSSSGSKLWSTQATTIDFYDELHISSDGRFISLAENLLDSNSGQIIEYNPATKIDEFIFGESGHNFSRSQHTVTQLQLGSSGVQLLSEGIVSEEDTTLRPPLGSSADFKGIVWLYYPEQYIGRGIIVVWMTSNGELLGNHLVERNARTLVAYDMENSLLTECKYFELAQTMDCKTYSPTADEPVWEVLLNEIPPYHGGFINDNYIYLIGDDNVFSAVYIGGPGISPAK
jgi:outer membrane protein assembly factor BamB